MQCAHDIDFQKIPQKIQNIFTPIDGLKTNHYKRNIETQPPIYITGNTHQNLIYPQ